MIALKFFNYVLKSQDDDLTTYQRTLYRYAEFVSKRIPPQWTDPEESKGWNQAIKFLYRQATEGDLRAFDYLKDLNLAYDKETRIPLSVDALYSLSLERKTTITD